MADIKNTPAVTGLLVHGQFAKVEDASFAGNDGQVSRSRLVIHDPMGLRYFDIFAMNETAPLLMGAASVYSPGDPVTVRVRTTKSGGLVFEGFAS